MRQLLSEYCGDEQTILIKKLKKYPNFHFFFFFFITYFKRLGEFKIEEGNENVEHENDGDDRK